MQMNSDGKAEFFRTVKLGFNKCLCPTMDCNNPAIRAHSVQKATSIALIEEKGHVTELQLKVEKDGPVSRWQKVGRNEASTFTGLCNSHDTELFKPIDTKPLDLSDDEQKFLIAYRSATRELHAVMLGATRLQTVLAGAVAVGRVGEDEPSPPMIAATQALYKSWLVWRYRYRHYDLPLSRGAFKSLLHSEFVIEGMTPVLASSSFFPIDDTQLSKKTIWIALNVVPADNDKTAVIFSYPKAFSGLARKRISRVFLSSGVVQLAELSNMILDSTENFFLRPSVVESWSEEKRSKIEKAFMSTVEEGVILRPSDDLMLFP